MSLSQRGCKREKRKERELGGGEEIFMINNQLFFFSYFFLFLFLFLFFFSSFFFFFFFFFPSVARSETLSRNASLCDITNNENFILHEYPIQNKIFSRNERKKQKRKKKKNSSQRQRISHPHIFIKFTCFNIQLSQNSPKISPPLLPSPSLIPSKSREQQQRIEE